MAADLTETSEAITVSTGRPEFYSSVEGAFSSPKYRRIFLSRYDQQISAQLQGLLDSTVGAGKARVQVNADLNVDKASEKKLIYGQGQTVGQAPNLTKQGEDEKLRSTGGASGGAASICRQRATFLRCSS